MLARVSTFSCALSVTLSHKDTNFRGLPSRSPLHLFLLLLEDVRLLQILLLPKDKEPLRQILHLTRHGHTYNLPPAMLWIWGGQPRLWRRFEVRGQPTRWCMVPKLNRRSTVVKHSRHSNSSRVSRGLWGSRQVRKEYSDGTWQPGILPCGGWESAEGQKRLGDSRA